MLGGFIPPFAMRKVASFIQWEVGDDKDASQRSIRLQGLELLLQSIDLQYSNFCDSGFHVFCSGSMFWFQDIMFLFQNFRHMC